MGVSSYFEFVVMMFGWVMYDNLWSVLGDTGIIYIPFLVIFFKNIVESRRAGDDEGNAAIQSLKKTEVDIILAIFVFFLAVVPVITINLAEMEYVRPALNCQVPSDSVSGDNTGTTYDATLQTFAGQTGRIPVWWGFVHIVTKSITAASIASIPCSYDIKSVQMTLANERIESPQLRKEVQEFIKDCYMPSKAAFYRGDSSALTAEELYSTNWIGSNYFLRGSQFYGKYYSTKAQKSWAYSASRDAGFEDDAPAGHPTCNAWWSDSTKGIRNQVLAALDSDVIDDLTSGSDSLLGNTLGTGLSNRDREDIVLRDYFAIKNSQANVSNFSNNLAVSYNVGVGDKITELQNSDGLMDSVGNAVGTWGTFVADSATTAMAALGGVVSAPGHLASGQMVREGSSIFQGLLLMIFIIMLLFLQILAIYQLRYIMALTIIFFAINYLSFFWGIAFWVDNQLMNALVAGDGISSAFIVMANPTQVLIIVWMEKMMYLVLPGVFLAGMSWVGFKAGGMSQAMGDMSNSAQAPANKGGDMVTAVATKGKK